MKRRDLIRHILRRGCAFRREGANHTVYWNPAAGRTSVVPRHREIHKNIARKICHDLGIPEP